MSKRLIYLLALIFVIAGITSALITANWLGIPLLLIASGVAIAIFNLSLANQKRENFWQKRSTEAGLNAVISTIAVLIIVGLINFLVAGSNWRFDLTENKLFTLAPQSQEIVQNLAQPLKVWIFDQELDSATLALLENYRSYSNNFEFEVVDPEVEINLAEQFGVQSPRGFTEVHLESSGQKKLVTVINKSQAPSLSEIQLTNAIANLQREYNSSIYFLQGHGEPALDQVEGGFTQAITALEDRGYIVAPLNLATSKQIPENTDLIAIAKPQRKLSTPEITALQNYLNQGGNLLIMLLPNNDAGLTPILARYGVRLDNRLVINPETTINFDYRVSLITNYGDHPITNNFGNGLAIFPDSHSLSIIEQENITAVPLILTEENTWAESDLAEGEITFNEQSDTPGPLVIAIALRQKTAESDSKMIIFGNGIFATNGLFQQQLNGDIFLNSVAWLTGESAAILSIRPREPTDRRINLSPLQAEIISWLAIRIMPLISFAIAGIIWWNKR